MPDAVTPEEGGGSGHCCWGPSHRIQRCRSLRAVERPRVRHPGGARLRAGFRNLGPHSRPVGSAFHLMLLQTPSHAVADTREPKQHTGRAGHSGVLRRRPGGVNTPGPEPRTEGLQSVCYTDRHGEAGLRVCRGRAMARSRTRVSEVSSGSRYLSPRFLSRREADLARSKRRPKEQEAM